jgi:ABC-type uncharacterized transport system permease subunit
MDNLALSIPAILLYLATGTLLAVRLTRTLTQPSKSTLLTLGFTAIILHGALLYKTILGPAGMNLGFFNALSLVSWLIALLLLISAITKPVENLGIALLPLAAMNIILELTWPSQRIIQADSAWQLQAHILISIVAYSILTIAMVQAILLAIQDRHLRNRQPGGFIRALPPLRIMETLLFQMIGLGFVLLTIGLIIGGLFLDDIFGRHLVHKTVLSIVAWLLFAILLWGRMHLGWRGRTAIRWTLSGFITLMLAYFGSKLMLELVLERI